MTNQNLDAHPNFSATSPFSWGVYVKPSLLEFFKRDIGDDSLIKFSDTDLLKKLRNPREGNKLAKKWAPVILNNALKDELFPKDQELKKILLSMESIFMASNTPAWIDAFQVASNRSVPPLSLINSLSIDKKRALNAEKKRWTKVGDKIEDLLAPWILKNRESLTEYFHDIEQKAGFESASLKKLSRFKPTA